MPLMPDKLRAFRAGKVFGLTSFVDVCASRGRSAAC